MKTKKGLILINAYTQIPHAIEQAERIKEELVTLGAQADIKRNDFFACRIAENGEIESCAKEYDFCVYLDKDKYASAMLEKAGLKLFNSHSAVQICDDKMKTFIALAGQGIAMPQTIAAPLCYTPEVFDAAATAKRVERELGLPVVIKTSCGSLGKGVFKADTLASLTEICETLKCTPHLFQRFVAESAGKDMRVIVVGGRTVAAMVRTAKNDFRSNIELGGSGEAVTPPTEVKTLCERVARILKLDFCGIDVLFGKEGYLLCEVNSNAFFGGIERATGVNVARLYTQHILGV